MARLAYGVPLVGNDFAVIPTAKPLVRSIPVIKPAELPEPEIDESLLYSIDLGGVAAFPDSFPARAKIKFLHYVTFFFVGLLLLALVGSGFSYLQANGNKLAQTSQTQSAINAASLSMEQAITQQAINFHIDGKTVTPSTTDIDTWLSRDLTASADKQLVVNQDALKNYLQNLAGPYNKKVQNKIVAEDGSVLSEGKDGQRLDSDSAYSQITNNLLSGKGMDFNLAVVPVSFKTIATKDIDRLLVAHIGDKTMDAYENGKVVKHFLISAGIPSSPTPLGQWTITRKFVSDEMSGTNPNGSHYDIPKVPYVSYFDDSIGAAIHANNWAPQTIFGHVNESLGCIGMTVADSKWVYDWAPVGTILINQK